MRAGATVLDLGLVKHSYLLSPPAIIHRFVTVQYTVLHRNQRLSKISICIEYSANQVP